jgi:hypothetical protein
MQRHIEFVVFYCFFFRVSPEEAQINFLWTLHQKIFWRCTEESNKIRPYT